VRRICKVKLTACAVKSSCDYCCQAKRAIRFFIRQRKGIVQRGQQTRRVSNVLKLMQKVVNMPRHTGGCVAVSDTIREDHAREIIAARKYC